MSEKRYSTGIVRKVDQLGRVVVPIEVYRSLGISSGDPLESYVDEESKQILFKKYAPGCMYCGKFDNIVHFKNHLICRTCICGIIYMAKAAATTEKIQD